MTKIVATYDLVKTAVDQLIQENASVSADAVLGITGGSKKTVLEHLKLIRAQIAEAKATAEAPPAFLYELIDPMARKVWSAAQMEAAKRYERNLSYQALIHAGLAEDNEKLVGAETNLEQRLRELEDKVAELTAALDEAENQTARVTSRLDAACKASALDQAGREKAEAIIETLRGNFEAVTAALAKGAAADLR